MRAAELENWMAIKQPKCK